MNKLYLVVREDIDPGYQVSQIVHGAIRFYNLHPEITKEWINTSETIVCLGIKNEEELLKLIQKAEQREIKYSSFREPDMDNQLTSVVFAPGENSGKLCSNLGLVLRQWKMKIQEKPD